MKIIANISEGTKISKNDNEIEVNENTTFSDLGQIIKTLSHKVLDYFVYRGFCYKINKYKDNKFLDTKINEGEKIYCFVSIPKKTVNLAQFLNYPSNVTSGSIITSGGVGIAGNITVGSGIISGTVTAGNNMYYPSNVATGTLTLNGGTGYFGNMYYPSSVATGTLTLNGGTGYFGNMNNNINANSFSLPPTQATLGDTISLPSGTVSTSGGVMAEVKEWHPMNNNYPLQNKNVGIPLDDDAIMNHNHHLKTPNEHQMHQAQQHKEWYQTFHPLPFVIKKKAIKHKIIKSKDNSEQDNQAPQHEPATYPVIVPPVEVWSKPSQGSAFPMFSVGEPKQLIGKAKRLSSHQFLPEMQDKETNDITDKSEDEIDESIYNILNPDEQTTISEIMDIIGYYNLDKVIKYFLKNNKNVDETVNEMLEILLNENENKQQTIEPPD